MANDLILKAGNAAHRALLALTGGRLGWDAMGMPVLKLTTIGRKSREPRSVMLTSPAQDADALVVVASKGGDDRHPAWFLNLCANPDVEVEMKGRPKERIRARVATADERARLWPQVTADHDNYAGYQTKTEREIPLVLLEPLPDAG